MGVETSWLQITNGELSATPEVLGIELTSPWAGAMSEGWFPLILPDPRWLSSSPPPPWGCHARAAEGTPGFLGSHVLEQSCFPTALAVVLPGHSPSPLSGQAVHEIGGDISGMGLAAALES